MAASASLRDRITGLERLEARTLQDHAGNWRMHPQFQADALSATLRDVGIVDALLVYHSARQGGLTIIDGHLRKALDPAQLWPCLLTDLDDAEADYVLTTFDPLTALAEANKDALAALMQTVQSGEAAVQQMLSQLAQDVEIVPTDVPARHLPDDDPPLDHAAELRKIWQTAAGQLWTLGEHRVYCGDCTEAVSVARVMQGDHAALVITDPPYGVSYADKNAFLNTIGRGNHIDTPIVNDHLSKADMQALWKKAFTLMETCMAPGAVVYCFMPQGGDQMMMMMMMEGAGIEPRHELIWVKNNHVLGRVDYAYKHEPILYAWKAGGHHFYGDFQTSLLEFPKPQKSDLHPTTKPVALLARLVENSSLSGAVVYDGFLGAGTSLMACEQLGRRCRGIEIDPGYVAVTLQRWADLTGRTPVLQKG